MNFTKKTIITVVLVVSICLCGSGFGKEIPEAASLMPAETVFMVEIDNYENVESQFKETSFYKMVNDPAMKPFVEHFKKNWGEKLEKESTPLTGDVLDWENMPQGRIAFGLVMTESSSDPNKEPYIFLAQCGENFEKIKNKIEEEIEVKVSEGIYKDSEDYRNTEIVKLKNEKGKEINYSYIQDVILTSGDIDLLKFIVAQIRGSKGDDLLSNSDYEDVMNATGPYNDISIFVNIRRITNHFIEEDETGKAKTQINSLGFDNVSSFGYSIGIAREPKTNFLGKGLLKVNGPKKGVIKMLSTESTDFKVPEYVPEDTYSIAYANLNVKEAFNELAMVLNSINPMFGAMLYAPIVPPEQDGTGGLQIKSGIIDHLGTQIVVSYTLDKPFEMKKNPQKNLVGIAVANRTELEKSLDTLHSAYLAGTDPESKRELLGYTIYEVNPASLMPLLGGGKATPMAQIDQEPKPNIPMPKVGFTVTDTYWIMGTVDMVENAVRNMQKDDSIEAKKWFKIAKDMAPAAGMGSFNNDKQSFESAWWLLRNMKETQNKGMFFNFGDDDLFDFSLLPEFEKVKKYFGVSSFYSISREDGFYFEGQDKVVE